MKTLFNYLSKRGSFPALITIFSGFVAALLTGGLSALEMFCILGIVSLQFYFQLRNKLYARLVPIEWLTKQNMLKPSAYYRRLNWMLAGVPLLLIVSAILPWLVVACITL